MTLRTVAFPKERKWRWTGKEGTEGTWWRTRHSLRLSQGFGAKTSTCKKNHSCCRIILLENKEILLSPTEPASTVIYCSTITISLLLLYCCFWKSFYCFFEAFTASKMLLLYCCFWKSFYCFFEAFTASKMLLLYYYYW